MEAREYKFTLPYPPSVNTYWRNVRGRMIISKNGRDYKTNVGIAVLEHGKRKPLDGQLAMRIDVYPPDLRRRDLDNVCKAIADALGGAGVYHDDYQIADLHIVRCKNFKPGRVEVTIKEIA